jgi:hypothetical protein
VDISNTSGMFCGKAAASLITTSDLQEGFVFEKQDQYIPVKIEVDTKAAGLPAHSRRIHLPKLK